MKLVNMYLFEDYLADSIKIRKKCQISYQPVRWTEPYRIIQKISPILYTLDFHNTAKKIHITHLKLASNISIHRRRLEIICK